MRVVDEKAAFRESLPPEQSYEKEWQALKRGRFVIGRHALEHVL